MTPDEEQPSQALPPDDRHAAAAALIQDAFAAARDSGKVDWARMHAGVLKNRLLVLTDQTFDEGQWGVKSFTSFLILFPELVRVDRTVTPPVIHLITEQNEPLPEASAATPERIAAADAAPWRLRNDLWSAVMDLHTKDRYVFEEGQARLVPEESLARQEPPPRELPTLSPDELAAWQRNFADRHAERSSVVRGLLDSWLRRELATQSLPRPLRDAWFSELKRLVRARLEDWFREQNLEAPDDMIEILRPTATTAHHSQDSVVELRALVVRCVEAMTRGELEELRLSPSVLLRVRH